MRRSIILLIVLAASGIGTPYRAHRAPHHSHAPRTFDESA